MRQEALPTGHTSEPVLSVDTGHDSASPLQALAGARNNKTSGFVRLCLSPSVLTLLSPNSQASCGIPEAVLDPCWEILLVATT